MGLYHKYRPRNFDEMLGNREVIQSLNNLIGDPDRPHVYLFTGPAGCGKTTAARIFAGRLEVDPMSTLEVNSANNRGIETARSIIDQARTFPFAGRYWAWIIDECHQTSRDFQHAMLKPLEDTPAHAYFFLCTTNPEKIIAPLRTRCTTVQFDALEPRYLTVLLRRVCREEKVEVDPGVVEEILDVSHGSPRAALVALEKVLRLEKDDALALLRSGDAEVEDDRVLAVCRAMVAKDGTWGDVAAKLKKVLDEESDYEKIRHQVLGYASSVLIQGKESLRAMLMAECFSSPFYDTGRAGVVLAAYQSMTLTR